MAESSLPKIPALDLASENLAETFRYWKRQTEFYLLASEANKKEKKVQTAIILTYAGREVQELYSHFEFGDGEDRDDPSVVIKKLEEYCSPRTGEVIAAHRFWSEKYKEPFDSFVMTLRSRAMQCMFVLGLERQLVDWSENVFAVHVSRRLVPMMYSDIPRPSLFKNFLNLF